jgi:sulfide:quinone oxidoreductase
MKPHRGSTEAVVVVGGGVAALETLLALRRLAGDRVSIVLVTPSRELVHRPLAVGVPFGFGRTYRFELGRLAESAGAELVSSKLVGVEPGARRILTDDGCAIDYAHLVVASGALPRRALRGAITFWGIADTAQMSELIAGLRTGQIERVAFAAHALSGWDVPLYELVLVTADRLRGAGVTGMPLVFVTHENEPLAVFGHRTSARVRRLFAQRRIDLVTGRTPAAVADGVLEALPQTSIPVDRVVTLPGLEGPRIAGLPADERGFLPVDRLGQVRTVPRVYGAGEGTAFPVKQDEISAQQAYTVASTIASAVGVPVDPVPFRPVLRGLLSAGGRSSTASAPAGAGQPRPDALWRPFRDAAGGFLASHLAKIAGEDLEPAGGASTGVPVEIELSAEGASA